MIDTATLVAIVLPAFPLAGGLLAVQTLAVKYTSQAYLESLPLATALLAVVAAGADWACATAAATSHAAASNPRRGDEFMTSS
mgnify:CR=1 FL=1